MLRDPKQSCEMRLVGEAALGDDLIQRRIGRRHEALRPLQSAADGRLAGRARRLPAATFWTALSAPASGHGPSCIFDRSRSTTVPRPAQIWLAYRAPPSSPCASVRGGQMNMRLLGNSFYTNANWDKPLRRKSVPGPEIPGGQVKVLHSWPGQIPPVDARGRMMFTRSRCAWQPALRLL
jgi:hypothetical protein